MTELMTIVVKDADEDRLPVTFVLSSGLRPAVALAALEAVRGKLQALAVEAEVARRVAATLTPDPSPERRGEAEGSEVPAPPLSG